MKRVIIPEDIAELLRSQQSFLNRSDVALLTADSNNSALALHRAERADLIIARFDDEVTGESLCRQIREDGSLREVSILLVGGSEEAAVSCNANSTVALPLIPAVLLQEAYRLLTIPPRKTCRIPVKIRLECETRGRRFTGMIGNISTAGLFFRTSVGMPEGATVHCTFTAAGSRQVTVSGEVVRVLEDGGEFGYGVNFFDITTEAAAAIDRLSEEKQH